ncbi:MAG: HAMP domain-containing protein [Nitrospira sp.]|nr:HAMP domain-containing protein [Nitrospira sp.]MBH0182738.1 HAMP domain-containing protein [Nitrospira sp.]MBH0184989.1 HAMP domain-containing protein [Nitrospira sp.]
MDTSPLHAGHDVGSQPTTRFFGLRLKFAILFSVIFIMACSSLSWYFIGTRRQAMTDNLEELGTILVTNTIRNEHFRIAGVVLEDRITLGHFMQSLMAIDHVVYVVITTSDGRILEQRSKRTRPSPISSSHTSEQPVYPDDHLSATLLQTPRTTPLMTKLVRSSTDTLVPEDEWSNWLLPFLLREETLYDFAMPVLRTPSAHTPLSQLSIELEENRSAALSSTTSPVVGFVRIGITDAQAKEALLIIARNAAILTVLIIAAGILGALLLTSRITTPLRSLASATRQLAKGNDTPVPLMVSTTDEVGELTHAFNVMSQSLHDRNRAIASNLDTIKRQVRQLKTAHQASAAIASANILNMDHLLDSVLALFIDNLRFSRMAVFLHHPARHCASLARIMGVSHEIEAAIRQIDIPVVANGEGTADLLLQGKPLLVHDIEPLTPHLNPPILEMARWAGVQSFVAVPLQSHGKTLGFLAGDRGQQPCTDDDLHILLTIAGHVAAAIDNAGTYADLAELTQHLEERIEQRTDELSRANTQLHDHDRRRSAFLSVVSHELRTPMTAIGSFADNMLDGVTGPLTELQHTYLARIQHNVARLGRIIVQLLDWSRLDTKTVQLCMEDVSIHQIATTTAEHLQTVAAAKQVSLAVASADSLPRVQGDRDKLEQVLWNLIGNAIKFTPPGGRVTVECYLAPSGFVQTCIADTGCGIDPLHRSHIFDEFSRVPSAMPASQGAQLGLCITKTLVTMHHGDIWVESTPGSGSRFYFTLPANGSHPASGRMA